MENNLLKVSSSPHFRSGNSTGRIMRDVVIALLPAIIAGIWFFRVGAIVVLAGSIAGAIFAEVLMLRMRGKKGTSADIYSSLITGILMAFCCTSALPWWMAFTGSAFGIVIAKHCFGGLGYNIFNPALAGRIFLMAAYPQEMTTWNPVYQATGQITRTAESISTATYSAADAASSATPWVDTVTSATNLGLIKEFPLVQIPDYWNRIWQLFLGNVGGCVGETSALFLMLGVIYMFWRNTITWHIPVSYIGTLALFAWIFGGSKPVDGGTAIAFFTGDPLFHILAGGLMLGALYMATDMVTSPMTVRGMLIFGTGCGILTGVIRIFGGYPEGVSYAIFIMNITVPVIDRFTRQKVFGRNFTKSVQ